MLSHSLEGGHVAHAPAVAVDSRDEFLGLRTVRAPVGCGAVARWGRFLTVAVRIGRSLTVAVRFPLVRESSLAPTVAVRFVRFAGPEHVGDDNLVSLSEGRGELVHKTTCAEVLMRLKHHPRSPGLIAVPRRLDADPHLRGVMSVVVDNDHSPTLASPAKPAGNAGESRQRFRNCPWITPGVTGESDGREGVGHVIPTGNRQTRRQDCHPVTL